MHKSIRKFRRLAPIFRRLEQLRNKEDGQAFILVLIFLIIGGLVIAPLLSFMGTGLITGQKYEEKTQELYGADAGIAHAKYEILYDDFSQITSPAAYDAYDFTTTYDYQLSEQINEEVIDITLKNIWVPSDISPPTSAQAQGIITAETLKIKGTYAGDDSYRVKMEWYDDCGLDLKIKSIGIWLSSGFSYVAGSSNLEGNPIAPYYPSSVNAQNHLGGQVVIFNFSPAVNFVDFPNLEGDSPYHSVIFDIEYTGPAGKSPTLVSWVDTTGIDSITYAWDYVSRVFHVTSVADDTTTEAHLAIPPEANLDLYEGALVAGGNITLDKDCTVTGDIIYGGTFSYKSGFTHIDGDELNEEPGFPTQEENQSFADLYKQEAIATLNHSGDYNIGIGNGVDPVTLGPIYISGDLNIAKDNIVIMTGPIYVEGNIDMNKAAEFSGQGGILAVGNIYLSKTNDFGTAGASLIMSLTGDITFKKEAVCEAVIYAPNGNIQFDMAATITGSVVAGGNIQADKDQAFTYIPGEHDFFALPGYDSGPLKTLTWDID